MESVNRRWLRRPIGIMLAAALAVVTLGAGTASAGSGRDHGQYDRNSNHASNRKSDHCITPAGVDMNQLYQISRPIVADFCNELRAGEYWTATAPFLAPWYVNTTFASVPPGFVPAGATPLDDFLAKFVAVKYVVDPGSRQQRTLFDKKSNRLWTGIVDGSPSVNTVTLSRLPPLRPGPHVVEIYWVFDRLHCDGLGSDLAANCLRAGENLLDRIAFNVTPSRAHSGSANDRDRRGED